VEITDDARKHGVADLDIEHAVRNAIRVLNQGDRDLYIGADRTGRLLEVVVLDDDGQPVAIHAMALRRKLYEHL
jgi:N-acetylmuramic acid 6-phosphate (MurNAc-6-P) etherase